MKKGKQNWIKNYENKGIKECYNELFNTKNF